MKLFCTTCLKEIIDGGISVATYKIGGKFLSSKPVKHYCKKCGRKYTHRP